MRKRMQSAILKFIRKSHLFKAFAGGGGWILTITVVIMAMGSKGLDHAAMAETVVELKTGVILKYNVTINAGGFVCGSTVDDVDGNTYSTVEIGDQCWMGENMRTTKYPDETSIAVGPRVHNGGGWDTDQKYFSCPPNAVPNGEDCNAAYPTDADASPAGGTTGTGEKFGLLYQWSAAMNDVTDPGAQGICPSEWHIPTDDEWCTLTQYIDSGVDCGVSDWSGTDCGTKLKQGGDSGFESPLPGYRRSNSNYNARGTTSLWSSLQSGVDAWRRYLTSDPRVYRSAYGKAYGFSVRCLKN